MESTVVLTWGQNQNGRLLQDGWSDVLSPTPIDTTAFGTIRAISCSGFGMHALNYKGEVWFWGMLDEYTTVTNGSKIDLPERACSISSGRTFGCALSDSGAAFTWTYARKHKLRIRGNHYAFAKAKSIVGGWSHVAVLLADGSIKTCHIEQVAEIADIEPFYLSTDSSDPVVCLAAGDNFTVALSKHGCVFLWREVGSPPASNADLVADALLDLQGQTFTHVSACLYNLSIFDSKSRLLRTFEINNRRKAKQQLTITTESIKMLATGDWHSGALLNNGQVLTWGNGSSALDLGRNDHVAIREPQRIESGLRDLFVFDIAFGGWHSAALAFRINN
ncbi:hypothetical protein AC1031_008688 [Aphanomyces cochlioides]|nr:hypothetical protein AC1031_008688 [Aphanomyces cochlioides]